MKTKLFFLLLLFALSCGKSETEIKGEIFVSTNGGQSVKLGAIPVKIVKKSKVEPLNYSEASFVVADYLATSDADGKFSVKVPSDEYTAIAEAKRQVFDETENYYWRVNFSAAGAESKLTLNNLNMSEK